MEASMLSRPTLLFESVAGRDYEQLVCLYAQNAIEAVYSYLAMKRRWRGGTSLIPSSGAPARSSKGVCGR